MMCAAVVADFEREPVTVVVEGDARCGWSNMEDRLCAVGGRLVVTSAAGFETTVQG